MKRIERDWDIPEFHSKKAKYTDIIPSSQDPSTTLFLDEEGELVLPISQEEDTLPYIRPFKIENSVPKIGDDNCIITFSDEDSERDSIPSIHTPPPSPCNKEEEDNTAYIDTTCNIVTLNKE